MSRFDGTDDKSGPGATNGADRASETKIAADLLAAVSGREANRECLMAHRTRRIVGASMGVIGEQKASCDRRRSIALAAVLLIFMLLGPLVWWGAQTLFASDQSSGFAGQFSIWISFLGVGLLASVLLAGWLRKRP